jgi:hypothetical protein
MPCIRVCDYRLLQVDTRALLTLCEVSHLVSASWFIIFSSTGRFIRKQQALQHTCTSGAQKYNNLSNRLLPGL